jgi:cytochrome c553
MKALAIACLLALGSRAAVAQTESCAGCHGAQGEGNAQVKAPRIAGLGEGYIARQLDAYANGARQNPLMSPIAQQLSPDARRAVAQAYSRMEPAKTAARAAPTNTAAAKLATVGDAKREIQACANCHGPEGVGQPPMVPGLAGQQQAYLADSLRAWKSGARKTDPSGQMNLVASKLQPADIEALSRYYAGLAPPSPRHLVAKGPPQLPATPSSGGTGAQTPVQGTGVTQGASTTQAPQGPGGGAGVNGPQSSGAGGATKR